MNDCTTLEPPETFETVGTKRGCKPIALLLDLSIITPLDDFRRWSDGRVIVFKSTPLVSLLAAQLLAQLRGFKLGTQNMTLRGITRTRMRSRRKAIPKNPPNMEFLRFLLLSN